MSNIVKVYQALCNHMGSYQYLEDEAIADVAFKAFGETPEELFYQAAMATAELQTDLTQLASDEKRELDIQKSDLERLLKSFLGEILYYKDAELLFATDFEISITEFEHGYRLTGNLIGGFFDHEKHPMHNDLKAITWHNFYVKLNNNQWECYVLIDI